MINPNLHKNVVALDRNLHRDLKVKQQEMDWSVANKLNAMFVLAIEFADVCHDYPLVFVRAGTGEDGKPLIAPIAVFGLAAEENLYLQGTRWRVGYLPAMLATYPFTMTKVDAERFAVCIDADWAGFSRTEGQVLFNEEGQPSEQLTQVHKQLEQLEAETQRTRAICQVLQQHDLLREMRFDAEAVDGAKVSVEGFMTVEAKRLGELTDAQVLELHRSGVLGLIHAHLISMSNMRRLVGWRVERQGSLQHPAPSPAPAAA